MAGSAPFVSRCRKIRFNGEHPGNSPILDSYPTRGDFEIRFRIDPKFIYNFKNRESYFSFFFFKTVSTGRALFIFYEERRNFILDCIEQNLENFHLLYRGHRRRTRTSSFGFTTSLIARRCPTTPSRQESIIVEETGIGTLVNYRVTVIQFARIPSATFFASTRFPRCARHESRSI